MHFNQIRIPQEQRDALKTAEFFKENGVYAYLFFSPYCEYYVTEVYFVSGSNGDEFGQFATMAEALTKARQMAKLSESERRAFDQ